MGEQTSGSQAGRTIAELSAAVCSSPHADFKENFCFDLGNPKENCSIFFNLGSVMTLSPGKDK